MRLKSPWLPTAATLIGIVTLSACGYPYFAKRTAAEFSENAHATVDAAKAVYAGVKSTSQALMIDAWSLDSTCAYGPSILRARGIDPENPPGDCKLVWERWNDCEDLLAAAEVDESATVRNPDKKCLLSLADARRDLAGPVCVAREATDRLLASTSAGQVLSCPADKLPWEELTSTSFISSESLDAIETSLRLLDGVMGYLSALDKLALDQQAPARAEIDGLVEKLGTLNTNLTSLLGTSVVKTTGDSFKAQQDAVVGLLALLNEWRRVSNDVKGLRKVTQDRGPEFDKQLQAATARIDVWQVVFLPAAEEFRTSLLAASYNDRRRAMSDSERREWAERLTTQQVRAETLARSKPLSEVIEATIDAHHRLLDVLDKKLTDEQLSEVRAENALQFRRLGKSLLELAKVFI